MSRPNFGFRTLSLVLLAAGFSAGCGTIYSDVYSPKRSRFVAPVERTVVTELPLETTTTTILPPAAPVEMAPAPVMPDVEVAPAIPGMEAAPVDPAMDAAPVDPAMGAVPVDPAMGAAPVDPAMGAAPVDPAGAEPMEVK